MSLNASFTIKVHQLISHHFLPRIFGPLILRAQTSGAEINGGCLG
jgi:hypothetical protein